MNRHWNKMLPMNGSDWERLVSGFVCAPAPTIEMEIGIRVGRTTGKPKRALTCTDAALGVCRPGRQTNWWTVAGPAGGPERSNDLG